MNEAKLFQNRAVAVGRVILVVAAHLFAMGVYVVINRSQPSLDDGEKGASPMRRLSQKDGYAPSNHSLITDVLQANAMLIELDIPSDALTVDDHSSYQGVKAVFCKVDWKIQKQFQVWFPYAQKPGNCEPSNETWFDLVDVVRQAREYDRQHAVHSLTLAGVIFHESRSGSSAATNLVAAADPIGHRVYSASSPPEQVLDSLLDGCTSSECSSEKVTNLMQDVLYLMGRSNEPKEERVFFKFMASTTRHIKTWTRIFPQVPWMFVYRDPTHVLMSHEMDKFEKCLPNIHPSVDSVEALMGDIAKDIDRSLKSLSKEEYCATYVASLCEMALDEHETNVPGTFIRYESLPNVMWERVLPKVLELPPDKEHAQEMNMRQFAADTWQAENVMIEIPPTLKAAAEDFLFETYYQMRGDD